MYVHLQMYSMFQLTVNRNENFWTQHVFVNFAMSEVTSEASAAKKRKLGQRFCHEINQPETMYHLSGLYSAPKILIWKLLLLEHDEMGNLLWWK
jgi:hypothetical protein